ncbi:hypothetical protein SAMN05421755_11161, partial [Nitrosomonas sp. Nm33]
HSKPGTRGVIAAIDNLFLKHTKLHLPPGVDLLLSAFLLLIPVGGVSSDTTLQSLGCSDNTSSVFWLIHKMVNVNKQQKSLHQLALRVSKQFLKVQFSVPLGR